MQQRPGSFVYFDDEQRRQGLLLTQLAIMEHTVDENANTDSSVSLLTDLTDRWLTRHHFNNNNSNNSNIQLHQRQQAGLKLHQSHEQLRNPNILQFPFY